MFRFRNWLTREEKRRLDKPAEVALRNKRRAAEGVDVLFPGLRWDQFAPLAQSLIGDMSPADIAGRDKMDGVVSRLMDEADSFVKWEWLAKAFPGPVGAALAIGAEAGDGPFLHFFVEPQVRRAVQRLFDQFPG